MPLKRESLPTTERPVKMLKMGIKTHDFDNETVDEMSENPSYSHFVHHESEPVDFEEGNDPSLGIRTDTISLLMKIEQLQAQLKYERRCRILAERELRELKEMNNLMVQMRHTANELKVTLDHVRKGSEAAMTSQSGDGEHISYITEPDNAVMSPHDSEDDNNYLYLAEGLRVPRNLYDRIAAITDYKKYTSALLMMLFDRETLATHSLQGRRTNTTGEDCQKPQLPPDILGSIIDHVGIKFGVDTSQIKTAIRTKLNNEDKLLKRRLGIVKTESKVMDFEQISSDS